MTKILDRLQELRLLYLSTYPLSELARSDIEVDPLHAGWYMPDVIDGMLFIQALKETE